MKDQIVKNKSGIKKVLKMVRSSAAWSHIFLNGNLLKMMAVLKAAKNTDSIKYSIY
ncbi:hypothetical protein [Liquorilactobacillus oeni]|uniref:Uncharacterized protein n=1 Tax=Liquorilactobacillus oeni DSM 19972 TaxID=1423777 RepID=A0A0R1MP84_9LACO|nr:hypothetical protein [Liquorilactobacillus oeni]KRL05768.1 hypothetical protein FD46_GL000521 [Liquorilactobacillus oeni DSM 19972]